MKRPIALHPHRPSAPTRGTCMDTWELAAFKHKHTYDNTRTRRQDCEFTDGIAYLGPSAARSLFRPMPMPKAQSRNRIRSHTAHGREFLTYHNPVPPKPFAVESKIYLSTATSAHLVDKKIRWNPLAVPRKWAFFDITELGHIWPTAGHF